MSSNNGFDRWFGHTRWRRLTRRIGMIRSSKGSKFIAGTLERRWAIQGQMFRRMQIRPCMSMTMNMMALRMPIVVIWRCWRIFHLFFHQKIVKFASRIVWLFKRRRCIVNALQSEFFFQLLLADGKIMEFTRELFVLRNVNGGGLAIPRETSDQFVNVFTGQTHVMLNGAQLQRNYVKSKGSKLKLGRYLPLQKLDSIPNKKGQT